jgi:hypothetical protein
MNERVRLCECASVREIVCVSKRKERGGEGRRQFSLFSPLISTCGFCDFFRILSHYYDLFFPWRLFFNFDLSITFFILTRFKNI